MGEFSLTHLLLLGLIVLIFFGPSRLPQLGQSLGKAIRGFKQGLTELDAEAKALPPEKTTELPIEQLKQADAKVDAKVDAKIQEALQKEKDKTKV